MYNFSEKAALETANTLVLNWINGPNRSTDMLVRQVAESFIVVADEATQQASTDTVNLILERAEQVQSADGLSTVYLSSVAAERRLANLCRFMFDVDNFLLALCTQLNQLIDNPGQVTPEVLTNLRNQVMVSEEAIRRSIDSLTPKPNE